MSGDITPFALRMPPELRAKVEQSAKENHRSLNAEIIVRLEATFDSQAFIDLATGIASDPELAKDKTILAEVLDIKKQLHLFQEMMEILRAPSNPRANRGGREVFGGRARASRQASQAIASSQGPTMSLLARFKHLLNRPLLTTTSKPATVSVTEQLRAQAPVDGKPTHTFAQTHKHDLEMMLRCCETEEANYRSQPEDSRMCAAPYYFGQVAILSRKVKNYLVEVAICERWEHIINDYTAIALDGFALHEAMNNP